MLQESLPEKKAINKTQNIERRTKNLVQLERKGYLPYLCIKTLVTF